MATVMIHKVLDRRDDKAWRNLEQFLSNNVFSRFSSFFFSRKTEDISKVWKINRGHK